jgi:hypothetical protein
LALSGTAGFTISKNITSGAGTQTYTGPITLSTNQINLTSTDALISFSGSTTKINGAQALVINSGSGSISFGGLVGDTTQISSLTLQGTGSNTLPGSIRAVGAIDLKGTSRTNTLVATTTLTSDSAGTITLGNTNGAYALNITNGAGTIDLAALGQSTGLASLTLYGTGVNQLRGSITTTGAVDLKGTSRTIQLFSDVTIATSNADVTTGTVDGGTGTADGTYMFNVNNGSGNIVAGNVGSIIKVKSLAFTGSGNTNIGTVDATNGYNLGADRGLTLNADTTYNNPNEDVILGAITLGDNVTLNLGNGGPGLISVKSISGTAGGISGSLSGKSNITIDSVGTVGILGAIGTDIGTLTITNSGGTTFSGAVGSSASPISSLVLTATTGTIEFSNDLYATAITNSAGSFALKLYGSTTSITNATTFGTSGALYLGNSGDTLTFAGGLTATAPSTKYLSGTIAATTGSSVINLATTPVSILANTTIGGAATGAISLGATTLADNVTLTLGTGISNAINLSSVAGTDLGLASNLTINTTGVVAVSSTIGTDIGTLTITNSGGTTFSGAVGSGASPISSLVLTATTGTIEFSDNLYATAITNSAGSFALKLYGSTTSITNATTFGTSGALYLGNGSDTLTFAGGLTATAPSAITVNGTVTAAGTGVITLGDSGTAVTIGGTSIIGGASTGQITTGAINLNSSLTLGTGAATPITLTTVTGPVSGSANLTINTTGEVTIGGAVGTNIGTLTITNSGGTTFSGALSAATLTITDSVASTAVTLNGNLSLTTGMTVSAGNAYNVAINGSTNTIAGTTTFANTGTLALGNGGDTINFTGGVVATAPSAITVNGTVTAAGTGVITLGDSGTAVTIGGTSIIGGASTGQITTGAINLNSSLTLGTGAATPITLTTVTGPVSGSANLTINTTGEVTIGGAVGTNIGTLTITNSGGTTFSSTVGATTVTLTDTTGAITFNGALTATTLNTNSAAYNLALNASTGTITNLVTFSNTGTLALGASGGTLIFNGGLTASAPSASTLKGTITSSNDAITFGAITLGANTTLNTVATTDVADLSIGAVTGATYDLTLRTGAVSGATIAGTSTSGVGTLTITNSGGTTFSGALSAATLTITDSVASTAVTLNGNLSLTTGMTVSAGNAYNVAINGNTNTIAGITTFANTGTLALGNGGDTINFTGGVVATAPSAITVNGTVTAAGTGVITLGDSGTAVTIGGTSIIGGASTGQITTGAINLNSSLTLGTGAATPITLTTVTGPVSGSANLTINTTGEVTIGGAVGTNIGTLTITNSGGTTFSSTVGATTVTLTDTTGAITFNGALTATTLNTNSAAYNLALNASTGTITNLVTFSNTGTLALGASGGTLIFNGGLTASAPSASTLKGTITSSNDAITFGAITLGANTTLNTVATTDVADLSIGAVTGATYDLTLRTGAVSGATIAGTSTSGVGTLTITNSGGTTFSGALSAATLTITDSVASTAVTLNGNLSLTTGMTVSAGNAYNVAINGSTNTIAGTTTFANAGTLALGNGGDTINFTGGVVATAPSGIALGGTINTNSAAVSLGATSKTLTLVADSVINTYANGGAGAGIAINGPIEGTNVGLEALSLKAKGGTISVVGSIGATTSIGTLTLGDSAQTGAVTINGAISAQALVVGESGGTNAFAITLYNMGTNSAAAVGTTNITTTADFYNTGAIQLGDHASDIFNFLGGLSIGNSSALTVRAQRLNATASPLYINVPTRFTFSTTLSPTTGRITLGAVTIDDGYTLTLGSGAATPMTLSSISGTTGGVPSGITFNTTAAITVSGAIGTDIGSFTITNSGGITFNGPVGANGNRITSMAITTSTGTIEFNDNLYAGALSNAGGDVAIKFYGSTTDVTSAVTLSTTGDVYYGDATSDVLTFSRGITHTTGNNILLGTFTAGNPTECNSGTTCSFNMGGTTSFLSSTSTFDFGSSSITLNNVILGNGVTLYLGGGNSGAITVASITGTAGGASSNVVINNTGAVSITGAIGTDIGTLTLTNSGGATFGSTVDTGTSIVISSTTGTVAFNGAVTTPTLSIAAGTYNLGLNATGTSVTNAVTFSNTGTLALGATDGTQTYAGGISATSPSATTLKGTINSTNNPMTFGAVTLGANTTLNTNASASTASITLGAVTGSSYNLTLSTGSSAAGASVTGTSFSGTGTLALEHIGGTTRFTEGVTAQALTVASSVNDLELLGATGTITDAVTFSNTGALTLGASGGSQTYSNGLTAVAPSGITLNGSLILGGSSSLGDSNTAITLDSATTFSVNSGGTLTIAGAVSGDKNLTIGGAGNTTISSSIATDSGTLTKSGTGTLTLSANNSFTGVTTINGGIVVIHADAALGTISALNAAAITLNNGALQASETFTLDSNRGITLGSSGGGLAASATKTLSYGGVITGNHPLTINGAGQTGTVVLMGTNGASTITISGGTLQVGNGGSTNALGSGAITNNGNLVFNLSGAQTISRAISGTGTVEFAGTGVYTLSGTNSYQGLTTLTSGTLIVSNASALGSSGQGITVNGGILDLQADIGSEPIILNGGSIATSSGAGAFSGALTLSTNTSFDVAGGTLTISGVISETGGSRSFTKTGNGILILSNANTYSGGTIVSAGILQAGIDSSGSPITSGPFGTGLITVASGGAIDLYGKTIGNALNLSGSYGANVGALTNSVTSNQGVASGAVTLAANASVGGAGNILMSGVITGSAKLTLIGSATVTLSAANDSTFSGAVTVDSGVLSVGADTNLGANTGRFTLNGGALLANASFTLHANRALTMTAASGLQAASGSTLTYLGDISGSTYALTINGNSQTGTVVLGGNNTYGNTTLSGGTARIGSNTALGSIGTISFAGGTLQYTSAYTADHSARFSNAANQAYAIDTNGETVTLATALTSSGGTFVKTGTGNLIFAADQTYTGSTTISAGTLTLGTGGTVGSVAGHIVNNSVLQLNRSDSQTYAGNISGSGSVSKLGSNVLTLTGEPNLFRDHHD